MLSALTNLTSLDLGGNQISNIIAIQNMANLIYLSLGTNQISDVSPLSLDTDIEFLDLTNNSVSSIDVLSGLLELRTLYLDNNQISDVTALLNLTHIGEGGTKIPLPCKQYKGKCINLGLCDNQISDIQPLVNNSGLGSGDGVDLRCNPLSAISINSYIPALQDRSVTVTYIGPKYTLNLSANAGGTVATPGIGSFTRNCSEIVTLNTTANSGYMFVNWSGNTSNIANVSAASTNITMNGNYSIQANFGLAPIGFYGDANEDGIVNLSDYSRVRLMLFNKKPFTPGGDADEDGNLSLSDYSRVRLMLFGKKSTFSKYEVRYDFTSGNNSNKWARNSSITAPPPALNKTFETDTGWTNATTAQYNNISSTDGAVWNISGASGQYAALQCKFTIGSIVGSVANITSIGITLNGSAKTNGDILQLWAWNFISNSWKQLGIYGSTTTNFSMTTNITTCSAWTAWGKVYSNYIDSNGYMYILANLNNASENLYVDYIKLTVAHP